MANRNIERAVRVALLAAGAASVGVYAPTAAAQDQEIEQIVVTGSRIPQPNLEGTSPVSVIGAQEVALQGVTQVEDLINNLPQAFADQGGNISNGATGTATVNLRNLGSYRTLVLINGRRMPAGDPRDASPDINQIPAPLIERVEVLTGGASAVYGSDAVAGVVNFIMKDNFEGLQFDANYNFYQHDNTQDDAKITPIVKSRGFATAPNYAGHDGASYELSMLMGANFADDKGNATLFVGYRDIDALLQSERSYSACALGSNADGFVCGGSSTSYPGRFIVDAGNRTAVEGQPGATRAWTSADVYNYGPLNYYQRPGERYTVAAFGHYDLNDSARIYTELSFMDDRSVAQIAPSGLFGLDIDIQCDNPLLSDAWRADLGCSGPNADEFGNAFILRRNVEGGGRQSDVRHTSYRGVVGIKGEIFENWNYDVFGQYGTVVFNETYLNDFSTTRAFRAMDVIPDPVTGAPVCRSVVDGSDTNCVPYDIWNINVTPEAINYLSTPGFQKGNTTQTVVGASIASNLGDYGWAVPTASSGIGVAFGVEYREEGLENFTDTAYTTGDLFGQGGPNIGLSGGYNVMDYFAELRIPLLDDVFLADTLSISGSYRYSDYSNPIDETTDTYGVGIDWAPIQSLKFRGSYQQAVRAPNVIELFSAAGLGLYDNDLDPCAGPTPVASLASCANTGVTAAQYGTIIDNPAGQYNALFGGNQALDPEESESWTAGIVFVPSFIDGMSFTVDYFDITVDDVIATLPPTITLQQCLDTGNPLFCNLITRDARGTLWATPQAQIVATNINLASYATSGFDVTFDWNWGLGGLGSMGLNMVGTYLDEFVVEPIPGLGKYDCAGLYGSDCGTPLPEWRHKARLTWFMPWNVDVSLQWRYFDSVTIDNADKNPLISGPYNDVDKTLDSQNYFDLAASWTFAENYTIRGGINNLTDEDPPLSAQVGAGFGNGNTYPQVYDAFGRYIFMGLTAKF